MNICRFCRIAILLIFIHGHYVEATPINDPLEYYIRNISPLPLVFSLNKKPQLQSIEPGGKIAINAPEGYLSGIVFSLEITNGISYRISSSSNQPVSIDASRFIETEGGVFFDIGLPEHISIEPSKMEFIPPENNVTARSHFIRQAIRIVVLRRGILAARQRMFESKDIAPEEGSPKLEEIIMQLESLDISPETDDKPWTRLLRQEQMEIRDSLWLTMSEQALMKGEYETAQSYFNLTRYSRQPETRANLSTAMQKASKAMYLKLEEASQDRKQRIEDYNKAFIAISKGFRIDSETRTWKFRKRYGHLALYENHFLTETFNESKSKMKRFRMGIGFGLSNAYPWNFGSLADDNFMRLYNSSLEAMLSLRFDLRLGSFIFGLSLYGETQLGILSNGKMDIYYDNPNLVDNTGARLRALNKARYSEPAIAGISIGLALSIEPRILNNSIIFRSGMEYNNSFASDFEVFHEKLNEWKPDSIESLKSVRVFGALGWGLFMDDLNKLEILYRISTTLPMEPFTKELPPMDEFMQTRHSVQIAYTIYFD